jgi:hypothetical protein
MQRGSNTVLAAFVAEARAARGLQSSQHDVIMVAAAGSYSTAAEPALVRDRHRQGIDVFVHFQSAAAAYGGPCQLQLLLLLLLLLLLCVSLR